MNKPLSGVVDGVDVNVHVSPDDDERSVTLYVTGMSQQLAVEFLSTISAWLYANPLGGDDEIHPSNPNVGQYRDTGHVGRLRDTFSGRQSPYPDGDNYG